jgi:CubicO group peptidase (beta-lactamase class C family)
MKTNINQTANATVKAALETAIRERGEIGMQVAAYLNGELVIDTWAGLADETTGRAVDADTLFNVYSVTKAVTATAIHIQAEKGLIDVDRPIAHYWPEFGVKGKDKGTVRQALMHRLGVPQMPAGTSVETICDWDTVTAGIADLEQMFPAGERAAYMCMSFGWILGEVVRRTDPQHRPFGQFIQDEICRPLGISDLWVGIPDEAEARVARMTNFNAGDRRAPADSLFVQSLPYSVSLIPEVFSLPQVRRACIGAVGGIFNARSEARFWSMLAQGGALDGVRLLSSERVAAACQPRPNGNELDPVYFNAPMPLSQGGYWMGAPSVPICAVTEPKAICCPGAGGSIGWADPETGLAVAICHNRMYRPRDCGDDPMVPVANAVRASLGLM